ncbi:MAG TPA: HDOD domain-containing protein, partial [Myxococcota bacterium]|nr:HDOD domain-containing protein [Myxococcota bacterium]
MQAAIRSETANAAAVAAIIQKDPGLLATVLRLVNSSYYGLPQRITRPAAAVAYLGLAEVLRVVVTAAIVQAFGPARHTGLRPLWRHASHTALIAQALTRRFARWLPAVSSWTLGLLHDLGSFARLVSDSESQVRINHYTTDYRCM